MLTMWPGTNSKVTYSNLTWWMPQSSCHSSTAVAATRPFRSIL